MADYEPKLKKKLRNSGCRLIRHGKKEVWHSPITRRTFVIKKPVTRPVYANNLLAQAGVRRFFEER